MPINTYFQNNYSSTPEQTLLEDLIIESIKIYGIDCYYLPRRLHNLDSVYAADDVSTFTEAYVQEVYLKSFYGNEGPDAFMSKFNLEVRDQLTFTVASRPFMTNVGTPAGLVRPREGDLIFFPFNKILFEIKFVDPRPFFYQLGKLNMYDCKCEIYEYSSETFNTGIADIDRIQVNRSVDILDFAIWTEDGKVIVTEDGMYVVDERFDIETRLPSVDNETLQEEGDDILDFSQIDPFLGGEF